MQPMDALKSGNFSGVSSITQNPDIEIDLDQTDKNGSLPIHLAVSKEFSELNACLKFKNSIIIIEKNS